ncbi:MAG: tetratricopeptide repeat protein, partial [Armatimonadota bacterium]
MAEADEAVSQAKGLIRAARFEEAVALLESWLEENPEGADGWAALGAAYFESEDYEAAASAARRAVDLQPESARAWCNMATVLRKCGELEEARTCCERALDLS